MHRSVTAGARQLRVKNNLRIITRLGERCTAVPLQVQGSDKTILEVHGSVRARIRVKNSYQIRREVHSSANAGERQ